MENITNCGAGAAQEDYDLCALGLLEGTEAEQIESHLARQCAYCLEGIRESQKLWFVFATAQAAEMSGAPRKALRNRILNGVRRESNSFSWGFFPLTWPVAANAALAAGMVVTTWYAFDKSNLPAVAPVSNEQTASIENLNRELQAARARAGTAEQTSADQARQLADLSRGVATQPATPVFDAGVQQALTTARVGLQDALNRLTQEQARAQRLETELADGRTQLAEVRRAREEAERIVATLPTERARLAAREQEIAGLTLRVQQLEQSNSRFRETVAQLRGEMDRNLKMVSFLSAPGLQMVKLRGTETGKQALGQAFLVDGQRLVFYASNLPALAPGRTYQLWVMRGRTPAIVSGGLFAGNIGQSNPLEYQNASMLTDIRGLAVTDEPLGGSPLPTGNKFLIGVVRPI